jgi:hypothetical protein
MGSRERRGPQRSDAQNAALAEARQRVIDAHGEQVTGFAQLFLGAISRQAAFQALHAPTQKAYLDGSTINRLPVVLELTLGGIHYATRHSMRENDKGQTVDYLSVTRHGTAVNPVLATTQQAEIETVKVKGKFVRGHTIRLGQQGAQVDTIKDLEITDQQKARRYFPELFAETV